MQIETYRPDTATETPASAHTTTHSDYCLPCHPAGSIERMRRPDLRAKKNTKPAPKVLRRQKWHKPARVRQVVDHELVLIELSRMQRAAGAL